jgi:GntR family transcriptional regulator, transcriptional repressor for pyruvate dehydrogenase complex
VIWRWRPWLTENPADAASRLFRGSRKVTDDIIEGLRRDISTGRLAIGARLPNERDLAQQFGVSQPTIREAVRALDAMGLVEVRHGSGAYVRGDGAFLVRAGLETMLQIQQVGLLDVLDVRGVLGRHSAFRAATTATNEDLAAMEAAYDRLDRMSSIAEIDDLIAAIADLQVAIAEAAHNVLQATLEVFFINLLLNLQIKAMKSRGLRSWQRRASGFQEDRRAIIDAISARDPEAARAAMSAYLEHQRETFLADPELASLRLSDPRAVNVASELRRAGRRNVV